jgi:hypothetical protein
MTKEEAMDILEALHYCCVHGCEKIPEVTLPECFYTGRFYCPVCKEDTKAKHDAVLAEAKAVLGFK